MVQPDAREVAETFEVPLDFIIDRNKHRIEQVDYNGKIRRYYSMPYGRHYIWGATAAMLVNLSQILQPPEYTS